MKRTGVGGHFNLEIRDLLALTGNVFRTLQLKALRQVDRDIIQFRPGIVKIDRILAACTRERLRRTLLEEAGWKNNLRPVRCAY